MTIRSRIIACLLLLVFTVPARAQVIIANVPDEANYRSISAFRSIFLMRLTEWKDGSPVKVFVLRASDPVHVDFCKTVLGVFPYQLQNAWDRLVFSGTGQAPTIVSSVDEIKRLVNTTPGAIGYIGSADVDDSVHTIRLDQDER